MIRQKHISAALVVLILGPAARADIFGGGGGGPIPDSTAANNIPGSGVFTSTINVASAGDIVSFNSVTLAGVMHTWVGDLQIYISSPRGVRVNLFSRLGVTNAISFGNSNDLNGDYTFTDGGAAFGGVTGTGPVPAGTYARSTNQVAAVVQVGADGETQGINNNPFAAFNGQSVTGEWTLTIRDYAAGDIGSLGGWSFDATIPGPGALALLGVAGLAGARRRRA